MSCYMGWLKSLPFLSRRIMINFIVISGLIHVNFTFGLLDCDRYIRDIVTDRGSLNRGFVPYIIL